VTEGTKHAAVLLQEAVAALCIVPDGTYVDGTFGRGGHSRAILDGLGPAGRLIALDRDPQAVAVGALWQDTRFELVYASFGRMAEVLGGRGVGGIDGVLLDLGVSSPQLDDPLRGFSFRFDAPLDMRMDISRGGTAAQWLAQADEREIERVVREYGEERFAHAIAKAVVARRQGQPVATTVQLATLVAQVVRTREPGQHPATRTFQALRIFINQELEELSLVLPQVLDGLKSGGRVAVISFHSLEDRIVKRFMRQCARPDTLPARLPLRAQQLPAPQFRLIGKPIRASAGEVAANPRARSAVLRVAEKS
jgi:16S rRNA (cytosine1402-N4)-methyltransferase